VKIGILNYKAGNLGSITSAIRALSPDVAIIEKSEEILATDLLIIPGVGAFGYGMDHLEASGLDDTIKEYFKSGRKLIGICLGMHLLASWGTEGSLRKGLDIIPGTVKKLERLETAKVPHLGWDSVTYIKTSAVLEQQDFYFAHSYYFDVDNAYAEFVTGTFSWDADRIPAIISYENCTALQFHPEKSSEFGMELLSDLLKT
jgi:glutamine amidotransferase